MRYVALAEIRMGEDGKLIMSGHRSSDDVKYRKGVENKVEGMLEKVRVRLGKEDGLGRLGGKGDEARR